jgi:hypothetical protein
MSYFVKGMYKHPYFVLQIGDRYIRISHEVSFVELISAIMGGNYREYLISQYLSPVVFLASI